MNVEMKPNPVSQSQCHSMYLTCTLQHQLVGVHWNIAQIWSSHSTTTHRLDEEVTLYSLLKYFYLENWS